MLEAQVQVMCLWWAAGDRLRATHSRAAERDRGEVTATTALIFILVVAAIAAAGVIASKITNNASRVPDP
ncbi:MAG TPA: hypothetical protein VNQ73_16540 [Ilumatobacter sp.]|nr:hypothetical protein [Ilumatobacter sp.]